MPATINYKEPNSEAACLKEGRVTVSTDLTPWNGIYSSVNTISNTGAFANIILKSLNIEKKNNGVPEDDIPRLAIVSGRTEQAVTTFLNYVRCILCEEFDFLFTFIHGLIIFSLKVDRSMWNFYKCYTIFFLRTWTRFYTVVTLYCQLKVCYLQKLKNKSSHLTLVRKKKFGGSSPEWVRSGLVWVSIKLTLVIDFSDGKILISFH